MRILTRFGHRDTADDEDGNHDNEDSDVDDQDEEDEAQDDDLDEDDGDDDDADEDEDEDLDEEEVNESEEAKPRKTKGAPLSALQSRVGVRRRGTFIADWAEAITDDFAERCGLGKIDYWLGFDRDGKLRARGRFLYVDHQGRAWYVVTSKEFARQIRARDKTQAWRIIDRLVKQGFVTKEKHRRPGGFEAMRLCLDWERIEAAYAQAPVGDDDG